MIAITFTSSVKYLVKETMALCMRAFGNGRQVKPSIPGLVNSVGWMLN